MQAERVLEIALRPAYLVFDFRGDFHGGDEHNESEGRSGRGLGRRLCGPGSANGRAHDDANPPPAADEPALSARKTGENESGERAPRCTVAHL